MNLRLIKLVVKTLVLGLLSAMAAGILYWLFFASNWSGFPTYLPLMIKGLSLTLTLFVISVVL